MNVRNIFLIITLLIINTVLFGERIFSDFALERFVAKELNKKPVNITKEDLKNIKELTIYRWVTNIKGIEYLTNLEELGIVECNINDISYLKDLTSLKGLSIFKTNVTDINALSNFIKLRRFRYKL